MADLVGRRTEREAVGRMLAGAQRGRAGTLVVRGPAGIGKTALLEDAGRTATASGFRVVRSVGVEPESQFAFAALHQVATSLPDRLDALPEPQQAALGVALGQRPGDMPDRFLVGLAVLNLLAEAAERSPLLCLIDDVQWVDEASAQVLGFVARRVAAERLALVVAERTAGADEVHAFSGLPEVRVGGLADTEARSLLATETLLPLEERVRDRIVAEARGNPLALLELPRTVRAADLAGGFELVDGPDVPSRVENAFRRRSATLPEATQMLLLVAAAEPTGDVELLWRAAAHLGIDRAAVAPAEEAGLLEVGSRVRFRHPLVRSAVYQASTPPDRRGAHDALATATDQQTEPDRRAWHRAQAVRGTDEDAAADLEHSAGRAQARGGCAAAAAFLEQATDLTPDPAVRARRALAAAEARHEAGASEGALSLLAVAAAGPLDALERARLDLLHAQILFRTTRRSDVPEILMDVATRLASLDPALARVTYLHAFDAALITGGVQAGRDISGVAEAARGAPVIGGSPGPVDVLLDGLVTTYTKGYAAGVPELRRALEAFCAEDPSPGAGGGDDHRWLFLASRTALTIYDDELLHALASRNVRLGRETGALAMLSPALLFLAAVRVISGEPARATELIAEEAAIRHATGGLPLRFGELVLAAWGGRRAETLEIHAAAIQDAESRGNAAEVALAQLCLAVLHNGLGNYAPALAAAEQACASLDSPHAALALPELIEAATRAEQPERATEALDRLASRARASGTDWALGLAACSRALTVMGPSAEDDYKEAIERLGNCRMAVFLARTHLVYGEWLRRQRRRQDARTQFRTAHEMLSAMGAEAFAERAAHELRATGEHPRRRTVQPTDALTPQELHIARLVATGATSREVGAQLFLSPRTIESHLRSIFRKLDITSRRQLREIPLP